MTPTQNVVLHLREQALRNPERFALIDPMDRKVTFGELWEHVCRFSGFLDQNGIGSGDRLVVMIPMSIDLYTVLLGTLHVGAAAVFVDPWMSMARIAAFSVFAEPKGFIGIGKSHFLRFLSSDLRKLPFTLTTGSRLGALPACHTLQEALRCPPSLSVFAPDTPDHPALITFTSGSSGTPKGANRTHSFLEAQYQALSHEFPMRSDDVDMTMFPVFALRNLADGITTVIPEMDFRNVSSIRPDRIMQQVKSYGVRTCTASPPFFERLACAKCDPGFRRILSGGAPIPQTKVEAWRRAFPHTDIQIVYGSTEVEPVASISAEERLSQVDTREEGALCAGKAANGVEIRIIPIQSGPISVLEPLPAGSLGEIVVSAPHVCRSYFRNSGATAETKILDSEGRCWHRMGDTGYLDDEGRVWLVGRVHSTIFHEGIPLQAPVLEARAARLLPRSQRVAVLEHQGQIVVVYEHARPLPSAPRVEDLRKAGVPANRVVVRARPLPLDPRHRSKTDYHELRSQL